MEYPRAARERRYELLVERRRRRSLRTLFALYPDETTVWDGPPTEAFKTRGQVIHARRLYPKHLEFFRAGRDYLQRCALCANRIGKTLGMGGYETAAHLTGLYPPWWEGRAFDGPIEAWAAGKTNETTRDVVQRTLLGGIAHDGPKKIVTGTGVIPGDRIDMASITWKAGVADLVDTVKVRHRSGDWSLLGLKSYQQGRGSFEGTGKHLIWLDEEPPKDVHGECLIRILTTKGLMMLTFTPMEGMSEVVLEFVPGGNLSQ